MRIDDVERTLSGADVDVRGSRPTEAGYDEIALNRSDHPIMTGRDVKDAIEILMAIGPAGEILGLRGNRAAHMREPVQPALREGRAELLTGALKNFRLTARRRSPRGAHLDRDRRPAHCLT